LIFLSDVVDGAQSPFLVFPGLLGGGAIFRNERVNIPVPPLPGYQVGQQRYNPLDPGFEIFNGGPIRSLLFSPITSQTLHLNRGFEFDYTQQGNLSIERHLGTDDYGQCHVQLHSRAATGAPAQRQPAEPGAASGQRSGANQPDCRWRADGRLLGTGPLAGLYNPPAQQSGAGAVGASRPGGPRLGASSSMDFRRTGPNLLYTAATLNIPVAQAQQLLTALTNRFNLPRLQGAPFVPFGSRQEL
jgi:hypothetical protein